MTNGLPVRKEKQHMIAEILQLAQQMRTEFDEVTEETIPNVLAIDDVLKAARYLYETEFEEKKTP